VSETAPTEVDVKPAPPVDPEMPQEEDEGKPGITLPDHLKDKVGTDRVLNKPLLTPLLQVQIDMEEIDDDGNLVVPHDEL